MICVNCFHEKTKVTNSRPHKKTAGTWRRRQCLKNTCGITFTTYEKPALDESIAIHYGSGNDANTIAPFSLSKLTLSIAASFTHDAVARQRGRVRDSGDLSQVIAIDTVNAAGLFLHPTGKSLTSTPAGPMLQLGNVAEFDIRRGPAPTSELVRRFVFEPSRPEQE